jgi:ATP-binding cassette subfamily B protein
VSTPGLVLSALREVARADRRGTATAALLQVLGVLGALGLVAAGKLAFDALLDPAGASVGLVPALLALALATALSGSASALQTQQNRLLAERVSQRVWGRVLDTAARADLYTYESVGFATTLERIEQNAVSRPFQVTTSVFALLGSGAGGLALSVVLVGFEPLLLPILLAAGIPAVLLARRASRSEFSFAARMTGPFRTRDYVRRLLTRRPYAAELRAFDTAEHWKARHAELNRVFEGALRRQVGHRQVIAVLSTLGVAVALAAALLAIVWLVRTGRIGLADAGAAAIAVRLLSGQLTGAFAAVSGLVEAAPFLADLERFAAPAAAPEPRGARHPLTCGVRLRGIGFRYPEQDRPALHGVDLDIRPGEVVALVGENGSGKSTLAKIVAGLYEPDPGTREWDGTALPAADLRASVSVIMQDFVRYQMSLRDNITVSDTGSLRDDAAAYDAARRSGALDAIAGLPHGLDTVLGRELDEGLDLSGGQWQRVALARALYRDTPLVILDEPTAALDPRAEHELFADVRRVLGGRAALLISHRFANIRMADRIYVLAEGRVIEHGTHAELVSAQGVYAELYALQSASYR